MGNFYGKYLLIKTGAEGGTITITQVDHATITASATSGSEGDLIYLSITLEENYKLANYVVNGKNITNNSFNLKEGTNTVTAVVYKVDQLVTPVLTKIKEEYESYSFYISNTNSEAVYYYLDGFKMSTLKSGESKLVEYSWGSSETSTHYSVKFSDTNNVKSDSNTATIWFTRPEKTTTYYTLTIVYSGCSKASETYDIEKDTTVNPSNYGTAPSGYTIKSRSPSSNFTMTANATITITCEAETEKLSAPVMTNDSSSTDTSKYYYYVRNNNNTSVDLFIGGVRQTSINANSNTYLYDTWGTKTSVTLTGYFVDLNGKLANSPTSSLTITKPSSSDTYYTLTITYSGCSKSDETYLIKAKTTVYPSNYGSAPSGYSISSRSPSSLFVMNSDRTITIYCTKDSSTETATFSVYVTDACVSNKCTSLVSGTGKAYCDTSVTTSGTDTACCSSATDLCMVATGCPYVFSSVSWDNTFTSGGYQYTLKSTSGGSGSSSASATYYKTAV